MSGSFPPSVVAAAHAVQPTTTAAVAASYTRHALTGIAGVFAGIVIGHADAIKAGAINFAVAHHWGSQDQITAIAGGVAAIVALVWSAYQKVSSKDALKEAIAAPAGKAQ